jgi:hypothetical protein
MVIVELGVVYSLCRTIVWIILDVSMYSQNINCFKYDIIFCFELHVY